MIYYLAFPAPGHGTLSSGYTNHVLDTYDIDLPLQEQSPVLVGLQINMYLVDAGPAPMPTSFTST